MAKRRSNKSTKSKRSFAKPNWKTSVKKDVERQESARSAYGFMALPKGVPIYNPKPGGRSQLDFMPYIVTDENHPDRYDDEGIAVPGGLWYKRPFKFHRQIGVENDTYVCPTSIGKPCPICEYRQQRFKEGATADEVRDIKPSSRHLYVVIPIKDDDHEEVPHIMEMSHFTFQELLNEELEEWEENAVFPDLEEGKTLRIRWASSTVGDSKPFAEASRIDFKDRKQGYTEDILDDIPNLDEILIIHDYAKLEAIFMELDPEDIAEPDEDEWEDEEPQPKRRKKSAKPAPKTEPDEDEWDDEEELEDDEEWEEEEEEFEDDEPWEEEDDDLGWEDEFEDEEEEEPEPAPKPKARSRKRTRSRKRKK